jgi:RES domain-containing protein
MWVRSGLSVCLQVPSVIIPEEFNLLVNPSHPDFGKLSFSDSTAFKFDPRMWK